MESKKAPPVILRVVQIFQIFIRLTKSSFRNAELTEITIDVIVKYLGRILSLEGLKMKKLKS